MMILESCNVLELGRDQIMIQIIKNKSRFKNAPLGLGTWVIRWTPNGDFISVQSTIKAFSVNILYP